jgi:hypothetical protein
MTALSDEDEARRILTELRDEYVSQDGRAIIAVAHSNLAVVAAIRRLTTAVLLLRPDLDEGDE